jgi:hypothetical protein
LNIWWLVVVAPVIVQAMALEVAGVAEAGL